MIVPRINEKKLQNFIWLLFIFSLAGLAYGLFRPNPPERIFENSDKVGHFIAFFVVPFLGRLALYKLSNILYWPTWLILAISLEFLQGELQPQRHFSMADAYANAIGVIAAIICYLLFKYFIKGKPNQ